MARMRAPDLTLNSQFNWDTDLVKTINSAINKVYVSAGVPVPVEGPQYGGITHVPFLTWMLEGSADVVIGERDALRPVRFDPGTVIVHCPESFVRIYHHCPGRFLRMTFDTDHVLCGVSSCLDHQRLDDKDAFPPMDACLIPHALDDAATALLEVLLNSRAQQQAARRSWVQSLLWMVHASINRRQEQHSSYTTWVAMRAWLEEHAHQDLSRGDCANAFHFHPNHVARLFQQHGNKSFSETLLQIRMQKARFLLMHSDGLVQDIAEACGFNNSAYFIKRFRQQHGRAPEQWRRQQATD